MSNRLALDDGYVRPKKTLQEKFSKEEIAEKLIGYREVKDAEELNNLIGSDFRYFVYEKTGSKVLKKFRIGGKLIKIDPNNKYIVLATGLPPNQKTWSVQLDNSELYVKLKVEDVINNQNDEFEKEIQKLTAENNKLKEDKAKLVKMYNDLVDKYDILKKSKK